MPFRQETERHNVTRVACRLPSYHFYRKKAAKNKGLMPTVLLRRRGQLTAQVGEKVADVAATPAGLVDSAGLEDLPGHLLVNEYRRDSPLSQNEIVEPLQ